MLEGVFMYFKVDRKIFKKALLLLKNKVSEKKKNILDVDSLLYLTLNDYIEQIEFALYKTKMEEFYIDYDFAQAIRPALLNRKVKKND